MQAAWTAGAGTLEPIRAALRAAHPLAGSWRWVG